MRVFITGITGTLGTALARLHAGRGDYVVGCARNETNVVAWNRAAEAERLSMLAVIGCASGFDDLTSEGRELAAGVDRVYHCAALKHVDVCERQPMEAFRQNVLLARCVAVTCKEIGVPLVHASTDKACYPAGVYGATKLIGERVVRDEGGAVVRFGNLIGSSGSVFAAWAAAARSREPIRVTDPNMTRYFMSVARAAEFLSGDSPKPGEVVTPPDLRAVRLGDVADRIADRFGVPVNVIGPRPGEDTHQWLTPTQRSDSGPTWDVDELLTAAGITWGGVK